MASFKTNFFYILYISFFLLTNSIFAAGPGNSIIKPNNKNIIFEDDTIGKTVLGNGVIQKIRYTNKYFIVGTSIGIDVYAKDSMSLYKRLLTKGSVKDFDISPDARFIAYGGSEKEVRAWDLNTNDIIKLGFHDKQINAIAFRPDGKMVASGSDDKSIRLWSTQAKSKKSKIKKSAGIILSYHKGPVTSLCFSLNGILLVSSSKDKSVYLYSLKDKRPRLAYKHEDEVNQVVFDPKNYYIASCGNDNKVILWSLKTAKARIMGQHIEWVNSVGITKDGSRLISASVDGTVISWDLKKDLRDTILVFPSGINVNSVAIAPKGNTFACSTTSGQIKTADATSGSVSESFDDYDSSANGTSIVKNGSIIASAYSNGKVKVWYPVKNAVKTKEMHKGSVNQVSLNESGDKLATCGGDQLVKVWDLNKNDIKTMNKHKDEVFSVAYNPKNNQVASGSINRVILWDVSDNDTNEITNISGNIYALTYSPNAKYLAIASSEGMIYLYNTDEKEIKTLGKISNPVTALRFNENSNLLLSGSNDGKVSIWNIQSRSERSNNFHKGDVNSVAFSPNDKYVASGGLDGKIVVWDLTTGKSFVSSSRSASVTGVFFIPNTEKPEEKDNEDDDAPGQSETALDYLIAGSSSDGSIKITSIIPPASKKLKRKSLAIDLKKSKQLKSRLTKTIYKRFVREREIWTLNLKEPSNSSVILFDKILFVSTIKGKLYAIRIGSKLSYPLDAIPKNVKIPENLRGKLDFDEEKKVLTLDGIISEADKNKILSLTKNSEFHDAVNTLYKKSWQNYGVLWVFKASGRIDSTPVIYDNTIYFGTNNDYFYALDVKTGNSRWVEKKKDKLFLKPVKIGPIALNCKPVVLDDTIYIGSSNGNFYAINRKNGKLNWHFKSRSGIYTSPTITNDLIFFGCDDGYLYALKRNPKTKMGELVWKKQPGENRILGVSPIVYKNLVIVGDQDGNLVAYGMNKGSEEWKVKTGRVNSPYQQYKKYLFACTMDGEVFKIDIDDDGKIVWKTKIKGTDLQMIIDKRLTIRKIIPFNVGKEVNKQKKTKTERVVVSDIYLTNSSGELQALDLKTGELIWIYDKTGYIPGTLASGDIEYIYTINHEGKVFKLRKEVYEYLGREFPLDTSESLNADPSLIKAKGKIEEYQEYEDFTEEGDVAKLKHDVYEDYEGEKKK